MSGYSDHQNRRNRYCYRLRIYPYQISSKVGPLYTTEDESKKVNLKLAQSFKRPAGNQLASNCHGCGKNLHAQMSDIDGTLHRKPQPVCRGEDKISAIVLKADHKMHSRRDIKIIAGGDGDRD